MVLFLHRRILMCNLYGTKAENVFWLVNGAFELMTGATLRGSVITNNGAVALNVGSTIYGRALTNTGALSTSSVNAYMAPGCETL
jgi:hypothetical protein